MCQILWDVWIPYTFTILESLGLKKMLTFQQCIALNSIFYYVIQASSINANSYRNKAFIFTFYLLFNLFFGAQLWRMIIFKCVSFSDYQ